MIAVFITKNGDLRINSYNLMFIVVLQEGGIMATESFYEDMVIDTPEAAANLNELVESGVVWERGDSVIEYASADSEVVRRLFEKYSRKK